MQLGTGAELEVMRLAAQAGIFLGIIYDLFKVVRRTIKLRAAEFLSDLVFALMFGSVFFVFSLSQTNYLRGFIFIGMAAGAAMWSLTVGRLLTFLLTKTIGLCCTAVTVPVFALINKIKPAFLKMFVKIKPKSENLKKMPKST